MDPPTALEDLQLPTSLTLLKLSSHILDTTTRRTSNASTSSEPSTASPALLAADLKHYRDLFSKLRFSYVEQVTKERFLRAVTGDPPEFTDGAANTELEGVLVEEKAALKERKQEVRDIVRDLEEHGRSLAMRYETILLQKTQLASLPLEITNLETTIASLRASEEPRSTNPDLTLPLQPTLTLLAEREQESMELDRRIEELRALIPVRKHEIEGLRGDLEPLQMRKNEAVKEAQEARRRREVGGEGDELEEKGRWLRGVEGGLRGMLEV